ncbi:DUF6701 domain-containing protein [Massilia sp. ST3]|uniref:DUF6701 domain-containing protein n=1 Tax=Massilia sp. ST3 TaxID=2824903 RepID=UPI001B8286AC|nr:DUF6701 domain-containing protein [Massilia sp. ST3]MBQ5947593.1 hypothetical protein [Massilia sp. ST3]
MSMLRTLAAFAILSWGVFGAASAQAQTALRLYKTYSGNINFTGTQASLRSYAEGNKSCQVTSPTTKETARLTLPFLSNVVSAQLYWAGSGSSPDRTVTMNGYSITASSTRSYTASVANGIPYFSSAADVTSIVKSYGTGDYTFSGLSVSNGSLHCDRNAVLGGFALLVVYSNGNESYRNLNIYEGFQPLYYAELRFTMTNFRTPDNVTTSERGRFGHIVWEGDQALSANAEAVYFTGNNTSSILTNGYYAPSGNQFNSQSSVNKDSASIGVDFDTYEIGPFTPKQNLASATFRATEDMILLSTAVLAVPSAPDADLALEIVQNGPLKENAPASYNFTVNNKGPSADEGPITVRITLPSSQTYTSATGTDWSCTVFGQVVTCNYAQTLAMNEVTPPLVLNTKVTKAGEMTVSATVTGSMDPDTTNNSKSVKSTTVVPQAAAYKFTSKKCDIGAVVGSSACPLYDETANGIVAGTTASVWVTAVSDGKAQAISSNQTIAAPLQFALGCYGPQSSTVQARYSHTVGTATTAINLDKCSSATGNPTWQSLTLSYPANTASVETKFSYLDVGKLKLFLKDSKGLLDDADITSVPSKLKFIVTRNEGLYINQSKMKLTEPGFAMAGEEFTISLLALASDNTTVLPGFGNEGVALRPNAKPEIARADNLTGVAANEVAELKGAFPDAGPFLGKEFSWSDIGSFTLRSKVIDYLGTSADPEADPHIVGRFYPAYFSTAVAGNLPCAPRMQCPSEGQAAIDSATHSAQRFTTTIKAHDVDGADLPRFNQQTFLELVPNITLKAVNKPGAGTEIVRPLNGGLSDPSLDKRLTLNRPLDYTLGPQFVPNGARSKSGWPSPTAVYLRAEASELRGDNSAVNKVKGVTLSSVQSDIDQSIEDGIMVVTGRVEVANVFGSERLNTRIPLQAQFWTGTAWAPTSTYADPAVLDVSQVRFSSCTRSLKVAGMSGTANCIALDSASAGALPLTGGRAEYKIAPIGANRQGSVFVNLASPAWLPSTFGQVTFGQYRSPVIYVREVY